MTDNNENISFLIEENKNLRRQLDLYKEHIILSDKKIEDLLSQNRLLHKQIEEINIELNRINSYYVENKENKDKKAHLNRVISKDDIINSKLKGLSVDFQSDKQHSSNELQEVANNKKKKVNIHTEKKYKEEDQIHALYSRVYSKIDSLLSENEKMKEKNESLKHELDSRRNNQQESNQCCLEKNSQIEKYKETIKEMTNLITLIENYLRLELTDF